MNNNIPTNTNQTRQENLELLKIRLICSQEAFKTGYTYTYINDIISIMISIADIDHKLVSDALEWMISKISSSPTQQEKFATPLAVIACIKTNIEEGADPKLLYNITTALLWILKSNRNLIAGMVDRLIETIDYATEVNSSNSSDCKRQVEDQDDSDIIKPCTISVELNLEEVELLDSIMHENPYQLMCRHASINQTLAKFIKYRKQYYTSYSEVPHEDVVGFSDFQIKQTDKFSHLLRNLSFADHDVFEHMIDCVIHYLSTKSSKLYKVITCRNSMENMEKK